MVYEVKYVNGQRTVVTDFDVVMEFVRDFKMGAIIVVWENGNVVATFEVQA